MSRASIRIDQIAAACPLAHTYSIVARAPATGQLGVAVQSHYFSVGSVVPWAEAGVGAGGPPAGRDSSYSPLGNCLIQTGRSPPDAAARLVGCDARREGRHGSQV